MSTDENKPLEEEKDRAEKEASNLPDQGNGRGKRLGFWAWIGVCSGGSLRAVRFTTTLATLLGIFYIAGGALYYGTRQAAIDTRVTGEGVLIPGSRGLLFVEVVNRLTHAPVAQAHVKISLTSRNQSWKLFEGQSDASGALNAPLNLPDVNDGFYSLDIQTQGAGQSDHVIYPIRFHRAYKVHLSTDKPLYQPGQTIHIRTLVLERPKLTPPTGKQVFIDVLDPKGNRLSHHPVAISRYGIGAYSFELSDDVALGPYRIRATLEGTSSEMEVKIARYALPKFKVTIAPEKSFYLAGETMRAKVQARYFFGKPVQGGEVRAVIFRPDGAVIGDEIKGKIGNGGEYPLSVELPADLVGTGTTQTIMVEVAIKDSAGQEERKQQSLTITKDLLLMDVVPEGGKLIAGMENTFYVMTTTPDGKPISTKVDVTLPDGKTTTLRTYDNGVGTFVFTLKDNFLKGNWTGNPTPTYDDEKPRFRPPHPGKMPHEPNRIFRPGRWVELQLNGEDAAGNKATRQISLDAEMGKLMVATDRAFYRPGETLKIGIQAIAQFTGALIEGVHEGQTIFRARATLKEGKGVAEIDLPPTALGTIRLDMAALDPYDVRSPTISRQIVVADPQGLSIQMTSDQPIYKPGASATLRFKVTDPKGNPKAAAIGLSVVDESVFALATSKPALARAYFLLEKTLMEPRFNLSPAETFSAGVWGDPEQQVGKLLFSYIGPFSPPPRFYKNTYEVKVTKLTLARSEFESQAWIVGIAVALILFIAIIVGAARILPSWAGGILLGIAAVIALLIPVDLMWVLVGLAGGILIAMLVFGERTKKVGWAFIIIPALGVVVGSNFVETATMIPKTKDAYPTGIPVIEKVKTATSLSGAARPLEQEGFKAMGEKKEENMRRRDQLQAAPTAAAKVMGRTGRGPGRADDDDVANALGKGGMRGMVDKEAKAIPRREVRMRQYFPETMYVHPELIADEKGIAELKIPIADSITEWRVSALASSADGKLGAFDQPLKVFQDFFVDLDTPVALVRGDEAVIPVAIYNYLGENQVIRLEVERAPWFELIGKAQMATSLEAGGVGGQEVRIRVLAAGRHKLTLRADGSRMSDAVAREILISEAGQERSDSVSGTLTPSEMIRVTVQVPDAAVKGTSRLLVKLFPSRIASAIDGLENALQMPHGCFEQTSSATYPNVLIYDNLKRSGKLKPNFQQQALRYISLGYQRLLRYEVPGGGFEWFGRAPASQILTAYGLLEFRDMSKVFPVDEAVIRRTQTWLISKQQADGSWSPDGRSLSDGLWRSGFSGQLMVTAYISWSLAESGYRGPALDRAVAYLVRNLSQLNDPYSLSLTLAALARMKHPSTATVASALVAKANRQEKLVSFSPSEATVYYGRGAAGLIETTALAVYALSLAEKEPAIVQAGLNYLAANRDYRGTWHSTQGTILALRALLLATSNEADQTVAVKINGEDGGTYQLKSSQDAVQLVDLGPRARQGANVIELRGQIQAPFQVVATYTLPWREKGEDDTKPLSLKVDYGRTKVDMGGVVPVDVKLIYRKPEASGMVLLSLGLPAGFTPIPETLEALKNSGLIARYELETGKINFYIDRLTTMSSLQFKISFKARSKVKTSGASSLAYLYYHPDIRATAAPLPVTVN